MSVSRRGLLKSLAVGAGAAPFLPNLERRDLLPTAYAAETGAPRRILFFGHPNGLPIGNDVPKFWVYPESPTGSTLDPKKLGHILVPLQRHLSDMVVVQNLEMKNWPKEGTSSHNNCSIQILTGSAESDDPARPQWGKARNASIDWHMSQKLGRIFTPSFPHLLVGVQPADANMHDYAGNQISALDINPYALYGKLFTNLMKGGSTPDPALMARLANRKSVLDAVTRDLAAFRSKLGKDDRERADVQLDSIRTLEARLSAGMRPSGGLSCSPPQLKQGLVYEENISKDVPELMKAMTDIVVTAFACDQTRICEWVNWGRDDHNSTCTFAPVNTTQGWHSLSHSDPDVESFKRAKVWISSVAAGVADKLKSIPEAGGTMLDNTLMVLFTENGQDHEGYTLQFVTIGGKNLGVKVGTYIKAGQPREGEGIDLNRFLVSLLNVMGIPGDTWGVQDTGKGPLEGFAGS